MGIYHSDREPQGTRFSGPRRRARLRPWWERPGNIHRPRFELLEPRVVLSPTIFTVDSTGSSTLGSGMSGTLPYVVAQANANNNTDGSEIEFDPTVFSSTQTITLGATLVLSETSGALVIDGPGADLLTISGRGTVGVFDVASGGTATISNLTIFDGSSLGGGGIDNNATLTVNGCTISGSSAGYGGGGGVLNGGTATLTDCTISGNTTTEGSGGGLMAEAGSTTLLTNCTVSGNSTDIFGGGLDNLGGTIALTNCTVSGNNADDGGGGIENNGTLSIANTIVADNTTEGYSSDVYGIFVSQGNNLIGEIDGSAGWVGSDLTGTAAQPFSADVAPLGDYGGPTQTMPLLYGSPAIDAGNNNLVPVGITTDERGEPRVFNGTVDIGAYELQVVIIPSFVVNTAADFSDPTDGKTSLREAIASGNALPGHTITFDPTVFASDQTITLTGFQLELSDKAGAETITGPAAGVTVSGGGLSRVFQVDPGATASISGLTITQGLTRASGGGVANLGGTIALTNVTVSGNSATNGGGVYDHGGTTTLTNCAVSGNSASGEGGGVYDNGGTTTLTELTNCTVSGNSAGNDGSGIFNIAGTATIGNTIVADNNPADATWSDACGTFLSQGNNLIGEIDGSSGWVGSDLTGTVAQPLNADVAPLGDYGGPTQTMPLLYGSPAIDAGNNNLVPVGITTDERGEPRVFNGTVDIGAYELQVAIAPSFVVNTAADFSDPTDGKTSLREAFASANALPGHTITFDPTVFASDQTITLAGIALELSDKAGAETITGPAAGVTVSGGGLSRVFQVDPGATASVSGLTITQGETRASGGLANLGGTIVLTNVTVRANSGGGLLDEGGTTTLTNCTVSGNSASFEGGGGLLDEGGTTTLTNCTVSGNSASYLGGGVLNEGGTTTLTDCTVSGNSAGEVGGGILNGFGTVTIGNTIVAENTAVGSVPDADGAFVSLGNNLIGEIDSSSGWVGSDLTGTAAQPLNADLAPMGDYGGPTQTMPLLYGSPAIEAGNLNIVPVGITTDERGEPRVFNGKVDIGAYEAAGCHHSQLRGEHGRRRL